MRWFILLLVAMGALYWWQHHDAATPAEAPAASVVATATPVPTAVPAGEASWPKRNINQAQGALDAVKKQREEL